jgi:hypothetical protein
MSHPHYYAKTSSCLPSAEDRRTHAKYVTDTGENIGFAEYLELRRFWCSLGGKFFGPNVEHGSMPESKLLPLLRHLARAYTSDAAAGVKP